MKYLYKLLCAYNHISSVAFSNAQAINKSLKENRSSCFFFLDTHRCGHALLLVDDTVLVSVGDLELSSLRTIHIDI